MKTSLIIFGMIFLVIGTMLYFIPMQEIKADTTTTGNDGVDVRTSTARVTVPVAWAFASAIIGLFLLVIGMFIPDSIKRVDLKDDSFKKVVETKEDIDIGDGNRRKIIKERTETHTVRNGRNDA
jgi:hypothetical protein